MLVELLRSIDEGGGLVTVIALARKLKVGESTLRLALDQLVQMGYLMEVGKGTTTGDVECELSRHCSGCKGCSHLGEGPVMWQVTEKGRQYLARVHQEDKASFATQI